MNKTVWILGLSVGLALTACGHVAADKTTDNNTDLKACLTGEALAAVQDGSAFAAPMRTTAKKVATACLNKMMTPAEQTPAVISETQSQARTVLTQLMSAAQAAGQAK